MNNNLKIARNNKKLTGQKVADQLNITRNALSLYENGKREASYETLKKLSQIYNVSIDYLLGNTNELTTTTQSAVISSEQAKNIWFSTLSDLDKTLINTFLKLNELQKYKTQVYIYSMLSPE